MSNKYEHMTLHELFEEFCSVAEAMEAKWGDDRPLPVEWRWTDVAEAEAAEWAGQQKFCQCQGNGCDKYVWKGHQYCKDCAWLMEDDDAVA